MKDLISGLLHMTILKYEILHAIIMNATTV